MTPDEMRTLADRLSRPAMLPQLQTAEVLNELRAQLAAIVRHAADSGWTERVQERLTAALAEVEDRADRYAQRAEMVEEEARLRGDLVTDAPPGSFPS